MGLWNFYFLAKIFLCFRGAIGFDLFNNILLAGFLVIPFYFRKYFDARAARLAHRTMGLIFAAAVFWRDSFFPPFFQSLAFVTSDVTRPSLSYAVTFLMGYWSLPATAALIAVFGISYLARKRDSWMRPLLLLGIIAAGISHYSALSHDSSIDNAVTLFFEKQAESGNKIIIEPAPQGSSPFDILFFHVCSMSWADLRAAGLDGHPFFSEFDLLLSRFNTVSSHSGPSMLHLLQSPCGQAPYEKLFKRRPDECFLIDSLKRVGYKSYAIFNHKGKSSEPMAQELIAFGRALSLEGFDNVPVDHLSYAEDPVLNNFELLKAWWNRRLSNGEARAMLYYNTMSLHVGAHFEGEPQWWLQENMVVRYKTRATKTFDQITRFIRLLQDSGRPVMLFMVPEHGAALVGNRLQAADLREIPLPQITTVPVGVKFIAGRKSNVFQRKIHTQTSYTAIAHLVREAILNWRNSRSIAFLATLKGVPETPFLADTVRARVVPFDGKLYYQWTNNWNNRWQEIAPDLYPTGLTFRDEK
jgi:cellulose synthase operon protein YhjU